MSNPIWVHVTSNRDPVLTTESEIANYTTQPPHTIDGLVGPFNSFDEAAQYRLALP